MPATTEKTCAHPECNCEVNEGQTYCSQSCADNTQRTDQKLQCQCGHPGCKAEAKVA
jgi:hypothetical protein